MSMMPKRARGANGQNAPVNVIEYVKPLDNNILVFQVNDHYVLSPVYDELEPIIGEFDQIPEDGSIPPCLKDWISTYSKDIENCQVSSEFNLVDLGLSVKWADMNIGATSPEEVGDYYAWGETEVKTDYKIATYKYYDASTGKYKDIGKNICETEYDVAYQLNSNLSLPNEEQLKELIEKCTWTKTTLNNVAVWEVKGPNGNKIYFPICGCKSESSSVAYKANLYIMSGSRYSANYCRVIKVVDKPELYANNKRTGAPIRPIASSEYSELDKLGFVDLGLSTKWANMNLGAENPEDIGNYYAWGETETKTVYKTSTYKYYDESTSTFKDLGNPICKTIYDAAYNLNKNSSLPTLEQATELVEKCTWEKTTLNDVNVWKATGPNGNFIYFPITGCISESDKVSYKTNAYFWTGEKYLKSQAKSIKITNDGPLISSNYRRTGTTIRPVLVVEDTPSKRKSIDPMIPYKWGQRAPFNSLIPLDPDNNKDVATGCSNTALAMIMAYWGCLGNNGKKYKRGCTATKSYKDTATSKTLILESLPALLMFDYDNLNKITKAEVKSSKESSIAVATLMKYIGHASQALYTSHGTGTYVDKSLETIKKNLRLSQSAKIIKSETSYNNFEEEIYQNLVKGYPVFIAGYNASNTGGHAFICDGYDATTDKFHINWGWDGNYNGWFTLSILKPGGYNYSYKTEAIINIYPEYMLGDINSDEQVSTDDVLDIVKAVANNNYSDKLDVNSDEKVTLDDALDAIDIIVSEKENK